MGKLLKWRDSGRELTLADHVDQFDASLGRCCSRERLESKHRPDPTFDELVILFNDVVEVLPPDYLDRDWETKALQYFVYGLDANGVGIVFVDDYLVR